MRFLLLALALTVHSAYSQEADQSSIYGLYMGTTRSTGEACFYQLVPDYDHPEKFKALSISPSHDVVSYSMRFNTTQFRYADGVSLISEDWALGINARTLMVNRNTEGDVLGFEAKDYESTNKRYVPLRRIKRESYCDNVSKISNLETAVVIINLVPRQSISRIIINNDGREIEREYSTTSENVIIQTIGSTQRQ